MGILVYRDQTTASTAAATLIAAQVIEKPDSAIGFAAGKAMESIYARLVGMTGSGLLDWSDILAFNPCEFLDGSASDTFSVSAFLTKKLYAKVNLSRKHIYVPCSADMDADAVCAQYEDSILNVGGLDLQPLTIGVDGSLIGNSGGQSFNPMTHRAHVTQEIWNELENDVLPDIDAPKELISIGTGTIMQAKKIIVTVFGAEKASAVERMIDGPITPAMPASVLQMHQNVVFILDEAAAAKL
jgi:glucosamine-6-phosphate deaminase